MMFRIAITVDGVVPPEPAHGQIHTGCGGDGRPLRGHTSAKVVAVAVLPVKIFDRREQHVNPVVGVGLFHLCRVRVQIAVDVAFNFLPG